MSAAPFMVFDARYGKKYGHMELRDSMWDSLTNLGVGPSMGITAENVADAYGVTREDMDQYALRSQQRAAAAIDAGNSRRRSSPSPSMARGRTPSLLPTSTSAGTPPWRSWLS